MKPNVFNTWRLLQDSLALQQKQLTFGRGDTLKQQHMKTLVKTLIAITALAAIVYLAHAGPAPSPVPASTSEPKSAACITNCEVYSENLGCLGTFSVTDPLHCVTRIDVGHYKGTCFITSGCNSGGTPPLVSATLGTGCCGPETVGWVYVQCADGTSNFSLLVVPPGASGAIFQIIGTCPPCGVTYCIKAYLPCSGQ